MCFFNVKNVFLLKNVKNVKCANVKKGEKCIFFFKVKNVLIPPPQKCEKVKNVFLLKNVKNVKCEHVKKVKNEMKFGFRLQTKWLNN